jgi:hypothetical protein
VDTEKLNELVETVSYQLAKVDQGGDLTEACEEQAYAVASALSLEVVDGVDGEDSAHLGDVKVTDDCYVGLVPAEVVVTDAEGKETCWVLTRSFFVPDCPADLEVQDTTVLGVFRTEASADAAAEKDEAALRAEYSEGSEFTDDELTAQLAEYSWSVAPQPLSY